MIVTAHVFPKLQTVKELFRPISKMCCFRTSFDSEQVKASQTLVKSAREHFYHIFSSHWWEKIQKISLLLICEILGVLINKLASNDKYPVQDCENLWLLIQMHYLKNEKNFLKFLFDFWNLHQFLNIFKKKMIVIANVFPKLQTVKDLVRTIS